MSESQKLPPYKPLSEQSQASFRRDLMRYAKVSSDTRLNPMRQYEMKTESFQEQSDALSMPVWLMKDPSLNFEQSSRRNRPYKPFSGVLDSEMHRKLEQTIKEVNAILAHKVPCSIKASTEEQMIYCEAGHLCDSAYRWLADRTDAGFLNALHSDRQYMLVVPLTAHVGDALFTITKNDGEYVTFNNLVGKKPFHMSILPDEGLITVLNGFKDRLYSYLADRLEQEEKSLSARGTTFRRCMGRFHTDFQSVSVKHLWDTGGVEDRKEMALGHVYSYITRQRCGLCTRKYEADAMAREDAPSF